MIPIHTDALGAVLVAAAQDVFATMLGMQLRSESIYENHEPPLRSEITALLGVAGSLRGTVFIHCSWAQGQLFTARLLGAKPDEMDDEKAVLDAIGELTNMLAGNLKRSFEGPPPFELSVPTVALASSSRLHVKSQRSVVIQLGSEHGSFHAELILERSHGASTPRLIS